MKKKSYIILLVLLFLYGAPVCIFSQIQQIPGLTLWLRADSGILKNQDKVYEWQDISGQNLHLGQSNLIYQPTFIQNIDSLNFKPALHFNQSYLKMEQPITIGTIYILCNYNYNNFQDNSGLITQINVVDGQTDYLLVSNSSGTYFYSSPLLQQSLYINQFQTYNFAPLKRPKIIKGLLSIPTTWTNLMIGYDRSLWTRFWNGYIFEIIIFDRQLTSAEQQTVENYLMNKYAPSIQLPNDSILTTFCPVTIKPQGYYTSYTWSTGQQNDSIIVQQSGTYYITATDIFGRTSIDSIKVLFPNINLDSLYLLCQNDSLIIETPLNPGLYSFLWNNGSTNPFLVIKNPGQYWITITDTSGCSITHQFTVNLDHFAEENLIPDSISLCVGDTLFITNSTAAFYQWSTGISASFITPSFSGWYKVTATNSFNCKNIDSCFVFIKGHKPNPTIIKNPSCINQNTLYIGNSTGNIQQWTWHFNDTILEGQNINHTYHQTGFYPVTLTVIDSNSCYSSITILDTVYPRPRLFFNIKEDCSPNQFTLEAYNVNPYPIENYTWHTNQQTIHGNPIIINASNQMPVILIAQDINNCSDTVIQFANQFFVSQEVKPAQIKSPAINQNIYRLNTTIKWENYHLLSRLELSYFSNYSNPFLQTNKSYQKAFTVNNLQKNKTIYGRIWTYNDCNDSISTSFQFSTFLPDSIFGLSLWLRSDTGVVVNSNNKVISWKDVSGNQLQFDTVSLAQSPTFIPNIDSIGNLPSVLFQNHSLILNEPLNIGTLYVYANYHNTSFLNNSGLLTRKQVIDGNTDYFLVSNGSGTSFYNSILNNSLFINNIQTYDFAPLQRPKIIKGLLNNSVTWNDLMIGLDRNISGRFWNGNIWEIILYENALNTSSQSLIERYLMDKYAPPILLSADTTLITFCPFTIKPKGYFTSYQWSTGHTSDTLVVTQSGKYKVTATDIFGRSSSDSIVVTFPQTHIPDTVVVCLGDSALVASSLGNLVDYLWSNGNRKNYAYVKNPGWYYITLTDLQQCTAIDSFFVKVDSLSITSLFESDSLNLCSGNYLTIQNIPYTITDYLWLPTNETTSSIVVNQSQQFMVEVTNTNGCRGKDSVYVNIIGAAPVVQFTQSHTCLGDSTLLTSTSYPLDNSIITSWQWIINQHDTLTGEQVYYTPQQYGHVPLRLVVQTNVGCSQFAVDSIIVYPLPDVNFNAYGFCEQQLTNFLSTTSIPFGQIVDYAWNFGDGTTSVDQHPSHTYAQPGNYQVTFTAISNEGCTNTISKNIEIKYKPRAGFYHGASCATSPTYFNDTSQTLTYYPILQWKWNFGDGTTSTQQNPVHQYQQTGTYQASLAIKIVNGCTDTVYKNIVVSSAPQALFVHDSACVNQLLNVSDASTIQNGQITKWQWFVGNQFYSNQPSITLIPQQTGNLPLLLIVESNTHCLDTFVKVLNVRPKPVVQFDADPTYGATPLTVLFDNLSPTGTAHWNFGDGTTSTIFDPQHTYNDTGKYKVVLLLTDEHGCYDSTSKIILVVPNIIDLSIENILLQHQDPYIIVSANVANAGTLPIENPDLQLWVNGRFLVSETMYDTLFSGDKTWYTFSGKINTHWMQPTYVCVQGNVNYNFVETNYQNNLMCKALTDATQILNIHPNPVYQYLTLEFQLLDNEPVTFSIFNIAGKEIFSSTYQGQKNYNRLQLDVASFQSGLYVLKIQSNDLFYVYKFLKL